ncbi:MAG: phosphoenolpyruvate synthase [Clostridia bacterium]|nr:phosphoenolpyruvate synthase [Clostridia bacterium]
MNKNVDKNMIGSKAYNLCFLKENQINVPEFYIIDTNIFKEYMKEISFNIEELLKSVDYDNSNSIEKCSGKIFKLIDSIENISLKNRVCHEVEQILGTKDFFSVRSSGVNEDLEYASFAGQFKTYLNVKYEDIFEYVKKCYKSLYLPNALKYYYQNGIEFGKLQMAVIVQKMIDSDISGVTFTENPKGLLNEMVTIVGIGVGENVVSDKVATTTYYYNKTDKISYYETQENSPVLSNKEFESLIGIFSRLEKLYSYGIDIEWAMKKNEIYILQVRPITTIPKNEEFIILDNSNIVESYPGITLPLTCSFIKEAYGGVFEGVVRRVTQNSNLVNQYKSIYKDMIDFVNGRVYYKISNWYTIIHFLPMSSKIIPIWQEMLGVSNKEYTIRKEFTKLKFSHKLKIYRNAYKLLKNNNKAMEALNQRFLKILELYHTSFKEGMDNRSLVKLYMLIEKGILTDWDLTLINDMYAFIYTGLLKKKIEKIDKDHADKIVNQYISCISNIESMLPVKELISISSYVLSNHRREELLNLKTIEDIQKYLDKEDFLSSRLRKYIELYGDRTLEELKLESKSFRQNPKLLIDKILEYTEDKEKFEKLKNTISREYDTSFDEMILKNTNFINKKQIKKYSKNAVIGIKNREISRLNRSRIYGIVREIFLSIGKNLYHEKLIKEVDDIFYLTKDEIFGFIIDQKHIHFEEIIKARKNSYKIYEKIPSYSRLIFVKNVFNKTHKNINSLEIELDDNKIVGIPCSNGIVTGEVFVVNNPKEVENVKNKILVTKMTDPGWVFLLTVAKGIIAEKGSLLSHTAIISRELGIPSIVGVKNITSILRTGDMIKMDGSSGEIIILERK